MLEHQLLQVMDNMLTSKHGQSSCACGGWAATAYRHALAQLLLLLLLTWLCDARLLSCLLQHLQCLRCPADSQQAAAQLQQQIAAGRLLAHSLLVAEVENDQG